MLKSHRCILLFILLLFTVTSTCFGSDYEGFTKLNPEECVPLGKKVVVSKLPTEWHKYAAFAKICKLKQKKTSTAKVSVIFMWVGDYYETTGESTDRKDLPSPLIVDNKYNKIGELPKIFFGDYTESPDIHYGKWQSGMPFEIRLDVSATDEDYYYTPLKWDKKTVHYKSTDLDKKSGKRPDALNPFNYGVYKGFTKLNPDECVTLDKKVVAQLPTEWQKYADFTKICKLKQNDAPTANVSIISIWIKNYFETLPVTKRNILENFPRPLIVDNDLKKLGQLPEPYPIFDVTDPDIYYGKWQSGIPFEILFDVSNPAMGGDYYYTPLKWNAINRIYEMKELKEKYGKRPN